MEPQVKQTQPNEIFVNDKRIYKDQDDRWITQQHLTNDETKAFAIYIQKNKKESNTAKNKRYWREQSEHQEK